MAPEGPKLVTLHVDVRGRWEIGCGVGILAREVEPGRPQEGRDVVGRIAGRRQIGGRRLFGKDRGQKGIVVAAEIGGPIVGEHERGGLGIVHRLDVRGDIRPPESSGSHEQVVAGDHVAGTRLHDDWLPLAEPAQALSHRRDVTLSRVPGVKFDAVDRYGEPLQLRRDVGR